MAHRAFLPSRFGPTILSSQLNVTTARHCRLWPAPRVVRRLALKAPGIVFKPIFSLLRIAALVGFLASPLRLYAQEIPLERCDVLPTIDVLVAGKHATFLIDTAATSILNLKSFTGVRTRDIRITSWSGTLATSAKEVTLGELTVGSTKLVGQKLPAVDLDAIGDACGRKIDGILGLDLIAKLGITIDLKKQTLHVSTLDDERAARLGAEMQAAMRGCVTAFNESDERTFGECLDPKIVLFTDRAERYGREQVTGYFRERYFHQTPAAKLEISEMAFHPVGEAMWYEYEFTIESAAGLLRGKGMAMCRKSDGRWRMASMHHSFEQLEPVGTAGATAK
jgi:hypothetical protein